MEDLDYTTESGNVKPNMFSQALPEEIDATTKPEPENEEGQGEPESEEVIPKTEEESNVPPVSEEETTNPPATEEETTNPPVTDEETTNPPVTDEVKPSEVGEIDDNSVLSYLSTKLGKELTVDDLAKLTQEKPEEDPYITKLKEWRDKTGRPIEDWSKYTKDVDSMSVEEILREKIKNEYPDLTEDQVESELDSYMILEDDDEDVQKSKELRLAKELPRIKQELKDNALSFGEPIDNLPKEFKENYDTALSIINDNKAVQEQVNKDKELVLESIKGLDTLSLDLDGTKKLDFKLDSSNKESILNYVEKPDTWVNSDGSFNALQMLKDAAIVRNFESIIKTVYQQGLDEGLLKSLKETTNAEEPRIKNEETTTTKSTSVIEGYDEMMGQGKLGFGFRKKY